MLLQRELWVKLTHDTKFERGGGGERELELYFYQSAGGLKRRKKK